MYKMKMCLAIFCCLSFYCTAKHDKENKYKKKIELVLYQRDIMGVPNSIKYADNVQVKNRDISSDSIRLDEFIKLGQQYIDTVKADYPVNSITFMKDDIEHELPIPIFNNIDEKAHSFYVLSIDYNKTNKLAKNGIVNISFWKNDELRMYFLPPQIDSLIKENPLIFGNVSK